jgi:hypothetical protein
MSNMDTNFFYVDETGDLTLLGRRGKNMVGTKGVSKCFMVGMAHIADPERVRRELKDLRISLINDPYLRQIPSMQSESKKTARFFHAKDDCPEVRMAVFKILAQQDIKVQVGVRRKAEMVIVERLARSMGRRRDPNTVYDDIVKTLFKQSLHKAEANVIYFARRGKSDRQKALVAAIQRAKENFFRDTGIVADRPTKVIPSVPSEEAGLQVIDYFLWALQRLYERGDDRYFNYLAKHYRLIRDFDDKRSGTDYGTWYNDDNPLTKEKIMPVTN